MRKLSYTLLSFFIIALIFTCGCINQNGEITQPSKIQEAPNNSIIKEAPILPNQTNAQEPINLSSDVEITAEFRISPENVNAHPIPVEVHVKAMNTGNRDIKGLKTTLAFIGGFVLYEILLDKHNYRHNEWDLPLINATIPIGNLDSGEVKETTQIVFVEISEGLKQELLEKHRIENKNARDNLGYLKIVSISKIYMIIGNSTALN